MSRWALPALLVTLFWTSLALSEDTVWAEQLVNPKPLPGDYLLPMPCGGQMAFRRVDTPVRDGRLEDRQVVLGDDDEETAFGEYVRSEFIVGSFGDPDSKTRFFWLGKYEVTVDQWQAVMGNTCPEPKSQNRRPHTGIGWFDAIAFTQRYSEWLNANARPALPSDGPARAFVRLPTEAEWEYAARGGAMVSELDFRQRRFPMSEPITRYAWYQGAESARGRLQLSGLLLPNPLGLFDILGNAEEIVLDSYRLNRGARFHGQVGGFIGKGGHFRTPRDQLRSPMRTEYPHFSLDDGTPVRLDMHGLRVTLATPILVDLQRADQLRASWKEERRLHREATDQARQELEDEKNPLRLADTIAGQSATPEQRQALERIKKTLTDEQFARTQSDGRAAYSAIDSGAILIRSIRDYDLRLQSTRKLLDSISASPPRDPADLVRHRERVRVFSEQAETIQFGRNLTFEKYAGLLFQTAQDTGAPVLAAQIERWKNENQDADRTKLREFGERFVQAVARYRETRKADKDELLRDILRE